MALPEEKQQPIVLVAIVVTVLVAVLLYSLAPAFGPSIPPSGPSTVYLADRISRAHRRIIDRFNQIHRGRIEVIPVDLPFEKFSTNERKEVLARSLRSKSDKIDIFTVDLIWVERFSRWCEPLDRHVSPEERSNILPAALESCYRESTLVALPLHIDIGLMYYRQDIIARLPDAASVEEQLRASMSWPEFLRLQRRLGYDSRPFYIFQGDAYEGLLCNYLELVAGNDGSAVPADRFDLTTPAARSALHLLVDLVHRERASPIAVTTFDEPRSYTFMLDEDAVFLRGWPNFVENFSLTYPDTAKLFRIRKAAIPHFEGSSPTSVFGGWNLMLSKFSTRKPEALEFIRFALTDEAQRMLFESEGFLPIANSIYSDSAYMRAHPDLAYYHTLLSRGFHRPYLVDYTRMSDVLSHFVRLAIRAEMPVDDALREASRMITSSRVLIK